MMASKREGLSIADVRRAAAKFGTVVEDHSWLRVAVYHVVAPAGKVWATTGDIHFLVFNWDIGNHGRPLWPKDRDAAIVDVLERIACGLVDCDIPDCDVCRPESEG